MRRTLHREPSLRRDVLELPAAEVFEQDVAHADGRDEQVRASVVVNVGKGGGHADLVRQSDPGRLSEILKLTAAQIPPELAGPKLIDEIEIEPAVPVHVGDRQPIAVIIMNGFVVSGSVIDRMMLKTNAAFCTTLDK